MTQNWRCDNIKASWPLQRQHLFLLGVEGPFGLLLLNHAIWAFSLLRWGLFGRRSAVPHNHENEIGIYFNWCRFLENLSLLCLYLNWPVHVFSNKRFVLLPAKASMCTHCATVVLHHAHAYTAYLWCVHQQTQMDLSVRRKWNVWQARRLYSQFCCWFGSSTHNNQLISGQPKQFALILISFFGFALSELNLQVNTHVESPQIVSLNEITD